MTAPELVELYRFARGGDVWRFTSAAAPVEHGGETYVPEAITRSEDEQGQEVNRAAIDITVPRGNAIASQFIAYSPEQIMSLTVYRKRGDVAGVIWMGRVIDCEHMNNSARLRCEPIFTALRRAGLAHRYGLGCRHFLYDSGCGVDQDAHKVTAEVLAVDGLNITVDGIGDKPDGYYQAGHVRTSSTGAHRMVLAHEGGTLTLTAPILGLEVGQSVEVFAGCPHTLEACADRFDNAENYGGFPFIPSLNPFGRSVL